MLKLEDNIEHFVLRRTWQGTQGLQNCSKTETLSHFCASIWSNSRFKHVLGNDVETRDAYMNFRSHGGRLYVSAGWVHQLENLQHGVKMAWDYYSAITEPKKSHAICTGSCKLSTWCIQPAGTYNS